jgi:DNA polymerase-3 subunit delta'
MARGDVGFVKNWSVAQLVDALHKLCHDLMAVHTGAPPRFFHPTDLGKPGSLIALSAWSKSLARTMRTMEHPFNAGLMQESLVGQAKTALHCEH